MNATRFILAASMVLAMALTFSCSSGGDEGDSSSSSDALSSSSSLTPAVSSSSSSSNIVSSSSSNAVSSSSLDDVSSSSLNDASSSSSGKCDVVNGSFTDTRNNKNYNTVKICEQTWMAENLNFNANSSVCYDNEESNCEIYGRLYNWETSKLVCPDGWHLPSKDDWEILNDYAGGYDIDGTNSKNLKATSGWSNNRNGLDIYGFAALPGGYGYSNGGFLHIGDYGGYWWSSTDEDSYTAIGRCIDYHSAYPYPDDKRHSFSVRCIQDLIPQL